MRTLPYRHSRGLLFFLSVLSVLSVVNSSSPAERPPHGQDHLPGPALSPAEAIKKMTVPPGFSVELVASEPDIVNPVAMTFDERGRIWITESLEYPRRSAGPGTDRVKVLESTKGDGKYDKITDLRRRAEHSLGHRRRPRRRLGRQLAGHPVLSRSVPTARRPASRRSSSPASAATTRTSCPTR